MSSFFQRTKNYFYSIATLSGTIIGVGIFALPYVTFKAGITLILTYFLILGSLVILIHYFFGELTLETPDYKRLPGFARIYLGKKGEKVAYFSTIFSTFGTLLAYLIVGSQFLSELLPFLNKNFLLAFLIYWFLGIVLIFFGIKAIALIEFLGLLGFFLILILIFFQGKNFITLENLFLPKENHSFKNLFLPYGTILFSLWGTSLIPEIEEMLKEEKKQIKKIIPISIIIPILIYLFFIYLILGILGEKTPESALLGLKEVLGNGTVSLMLTLGLITTFTSFLTLGLTLKKVFWYDLKIGKTKAFFLTALIPLFLFLLGVNKFLPIISFIGGVLLGIEGILILLMYYKNFKNKISSAKIKLVYFLILVLAIGIVSEIIFFF